MDLRRIHCCPHFIFRSVIYKSNKNLKLFEIGNTYYLDHKENVETKLLSISISGEIFNESWLNKDQIDNFYYIKGLIKRLCNDLSLKVKFISKNDYNYSKKLVIIKGKDAIGCIGEINKNLLNNYSINISSAKIHAFPPAPGCQSGQAPRLKATIFIYLAD